MPLQPLERFPKEFLTICCSLVLFPALSCFSAIAGAWAVGDNDIESARDMWADPWVSTYVRVHMPVHLLAHKRTCPSKAQHYCQCIVYYNRYRHLIYVYIYIRYIFCIIILYCTGSTAQGGGGSFKNRKPIGEIGCCESGMADRSHWWTKRCLRSPLFLSLSLTIYLPTYLSIFYVSIYLSIYLSLSLI